MQKMKINKEEEMLDDNHPGKKKLEKNEEVMEDDDKGEHPINLQKKRKGQNLPNPGKKNRKVLTVRDFYKKRKHLQHIRYIEAMKITESIWFLIFRFIPLNVKLINFIGVNRYISTVTLKYYEVVYNRGIKFCKRKFT
jgi:hypothetical protein